MNYLLYLCIWKLYWTWLISISELIANFTLLTVWSSLYCFYQKMVPVLSYKPGQQSDLAHGVPGTKKIISYKQPADFLILKLSSIKAAWLKIHANLKKTSKYLKVKYCTCIHFSQVWFSWKKISHLEACIFNGH
jgi:hypothetical protein